MPCDYSKYPPNWKTEIRPRILERESNCCKQCLVPNYSMIRRGHCESDSGFVDAYEDENGIVYNADNGEIIKYVDVYSKNCQKPLKWIKIILTIAHLDHDEENWEIKDERLAALCQRCHIRYDAKEKSKRRRMKNE